MTRFEAWSLHVANLLVGGSGLLYAIVLYALEPADEFALVNHPVQPHLLHLHLWTAPLLVLAIGAVWRSHGWACNRYGVGSRRSSGRTLLASALPMILSGCFLQTAVEPGWQQAWRSVHLAASALWLAGALVHVATARRRTKASPAARESERIGA